MKKRNSSPRAPVERVDSIHVRSAEPPPTASHPQQCRQPVRQLRAGGRPWFLTGKNNQKVRKTI